MSENMRQDEDGNWVPAEPIGPQGKVARLEFTLRSWGWVRIPNLLAKWDERGLGK